MLDPRHKEINCTAPFCSDCWQVIKGNILGVMDVADKLRNQARGTDLPTERPNTNTRLVGGANDAPKKEGTL